MKSKHRRDPRYEQADKRIRSAFLELYEKKDIDTITASELIESAGVNRSTFYAHYSDKFDLMNSIEADLVEQMLSIFKSSPTLDLMLGQEPSTAMWRDYFGRLIDLLQGNRRLFAGLIEHRDGKLMTLFSSEFAKVLRESGSTSRFGIPVNYRAALLAWSTAGLVEEWARGGFVDERERVVEILMRTATGIQSALSESASHEEAASGDRS